MEPYRDDADLAAALQAMRPEPSLAFAAALDERAAAGFPRRAPLGDARLGDILARLRALPPRRVLLSAGATALTAIVVATTVVSIGEPGSPSAPSLSPHPGSEGAGAASGRPSLSAPKAQVYGAGAGNITPQPEAPVPSASLGYAAGEGASTAAGVGQSGSFAFKNAGHRDVERSAEMVLGAEPSEVGDDAAKVFEAVHANHGIVLSSSIDGGTAGHAGARFHLVIPSAKLSDALAAFSGIAEVRSRHDGTEDITAPTVALGEQLQDSKAKIEGLLVQLAGSDFLGSSDTNTERTEIEAELSAERRHAAILRSRLAKLDRRASLSHVSLRIESGAVSTSSSGSGGWGPGDALGSAGHILGIAAGVAIVGLAVLGPILLIALLAWLAQRAWIRRSRDRALG
jgi:hypothetical protein